MKKKIMIEGMSCGHCVNHVKGALEDIKGVTTVEVDLKGKFAIAELIDDVKDGDLKFAIEDAGYDVVKIDLI